MHKLLLKYCAVITALAPLLHAEVYVIRGRVLDSKGHEVSSANVEALELQVPRIVRPWVLSKKDGSFELQNLEPGKYRLYAWKEGEGVPNMAGVVFWGIGQQFPELTVGPEMPAINIDLKLPPAYGSISGLIEDAETHVPIKNARMRLERFGRPDIMYETNTEANGRFAAFLPERPMKVSINAPGYEPWTYQPNSVNDGITLRANEKLTVNVYLHRMTSPQKNF